MTQHAASASPDQLQSELNDQTNRWFYGPGLGRSITNVGAVVVFPPYALYLLGNAGLALAGYNQIHVTDALPETPRKYVSGVYDGVTSLPGRITSSIAGEPYRDQ